MLSNQTRSIAGNGVNFDTASLVIALTSSPDFFRDMLQVKIAREIAKSRYAIREGAAFTSTLEVIDEPKIVESTATAYYDSPSHLNETDDSLIDEPLPRMPVNVQTIKLKFIMKGKAKARIIDDTELID